MNSVSMKTIGSAKYTCHIAMVKTSENIHNKYNHPIIYMYRCTVYM